MRQVIMRMQVTLDGFLGAPDGSVDWAFRSFDDAFTEWAVDSLWKAGVHVMGANTGRGLAEYWPTSTQPFAPPMNEIPKIVFSKTIDHLDWNETTINRGDVAEEMRKLKEQSGGYILVHGGVQFVHSLARLGLIDEYRLVIHPVALGKGLPLFPEFSEPFELETLETRTFPSGAVLQVYRPVVKAAHAGALQSARTT